MPDMVLIPSLFDYGLTDAIDRTQTISMQQAEKIMHFFALHPLFQWTKSHNGCEARADAICVLLEAWGIPHFKAWIFGGYFLKKHVGGLQQNWNYHVAPLLPVREQETISLLVMDPSTSVELQPLKQWAAGVTAYPHSYHFIKDAAAYIFSEQQIRKNNWYQRNKQNRRWMIQGLAGINSLKANGKAALVFNKQRIRNTAHTWERLKRTPILF
jgi:hypothetical protein